MITITNKDPISVDEYREGRYLVIRRYDSFVTVHDAEALEEAVELALSMCESASGYVLLADFPRGENANKLDLRYVGRLKSVDRTYPVYVHEGKVFHVVAQETHHPDLYYYLAFCTLPAEVDALLCASKHFTFLGVEP